MKIDRRSFLTLGIGATAGITLSPLPWKITDDLSIWSQNWPWTPVPPDGKATYTKSTCTLCPGGCGILVRKIDDRVVKIEGLPGHPVNDGGVCILGAAAPQFLYNPNRIKAPLKKVDSGWREISWGEALQIISEKLKALRAEGKAHTVACLSDSDRGTVNLLLSRFLTAYGSPNFLKMPYMEDAYALAMERMQGGRFFPAFDIENSDFVLSFGCGLLDGWGSPVRMFRTKSLLKDRKFQVIQFEPRLSNTAAKADQWIPINPGTEAVMALGIANVMLRESLYNQEFINDLTDNFEPWAQSVTNTFTPEYVSKVTGVDPTLIQITARRFAAASRPIALYGRGEGKVPGSSHEAAAVHILNVLMANLDRKGGVWAMPEPDYTAWPEVQMDRAAAMGMQQPRIDGGSATDSHARYLTDRLAPILLDEKSPKLNMLFVSNANPCYSLQGTPEVVAALETIPFKVSFSSYLDETAKRCDLILPNHMFLERFEDVPVTAGISRLIIGLSRPVVAPQYNTMHTGDMVINLAKAMGGTIAEAFPWRTYESCLKKTLAQTWNQLEDNGYWEAKYFSPHSMYDGYETDTGKLKFPGPVSAQQVTIAAQGAPNEFPLTLIPADSIRLSTRYAFSPPFLIKTVPDTVLKDQDLCIQINPATAKEHGLSDECMAELQTPKGTARVRVHLSDGTMPGVVAMATGLGHSAFDKYLADKGVNYNALVEPMADPISGLNVTWGIRAKLTRA